MLYDDVHVVRGKLLGLGIKFLVIFVRHYQIKNDFFTK